MKIVAIIARILLGLIFFVFGLNGFLHFIPAPPMTGLAGAFIGALIASHYVLFVCTFQVVGGALLLINQFEPLALVLLAPVIVNILIYHVTMEPSGIAPGLVAAILWAILAYRLRAYFAPLFVRKAVPK